MQAAGLIASDICMEKIIRRVWSKQKQDLEDRLSPKQEAVMRLQEVLRARMGVDVVDISDADNQRSRPAVTYYNTVREGGEPEVFYIGTNAIVEMAGGKVTKDALLKQLEALGFLLRPNVRGMVHDRVPGLGGPKWRHYRVHFPSQENES